MAREINLVPDIKNEVIKAIKLRNFIYFLSIVIASASIGATLVTAITLGGQQLALDSKKNTISILSEKLNSYGDLKDFLTIRDQLGNIEELTNNKKVLSRTFNILSALIPTGADSIKISELNVDLSALTPTIDFQGQANAGQEPFIDYNVLDGFKKSMKYMRYDYGRYIDKNGEEIPAYCMIETDDSGSILKDLDRGTFAYWTIEAEGCNPSKKDDDSNNSSSSQSVSYAKEDYNGQQVVRIWRTPQFSEWYNSNNENQSRITLDGKITNEPHFESSCITYTGYKDTNFTPSADQTIMAKSGDITWVSQNSSCKLVPEEEAGIAIYDSSNGRDENGELVLRFSSTIRFAEEVFDFNNKHMLALAPSGRRNVTDSYVQIQAMFGERANDCAEGDESCANTQNSDGSKSNKNVNNNGGN